MKYIVDNFEDVENIMLLYFKDFNNKLYTLLESDINLPTDVIKYKIMKYI